MLNLPYERSPGFPSCGYDAEGDVLRHKVTVDFSGASYVTRHVPTPEELARRE
ncbi:hypothetical protein ACFVZR_37940 [Streptomyces sp. NPDC058316]|uniref:hypothetical protein n=1 Tax=unclassified Streptomyces TaxID=2593676 RepID=UPI00332A0473